MKKNTHPDVHPVIFLDTSCGAEFIATSTLKSESTREVNGVTHYVIPVEISSASHPFYTGKQILVDTARRVEKFQERAAKQSGASTRKGKTAKRAAKTEKRKSKSTEKEI